MNKILYVILHTHIYIYDFNKNKYRWKRSARPMKYRFALPNRILEVIERHLAGDARVRFRFFVFWPGKHIIRPVASC